MLDSNRLVPHDLSATTGVKVFYDRKCFKHKRYYQYKKFENFRYKSCNKFINLFLATNREMITFVDFGSNRIKMNRTYPFSGRYEEIKIYLEKTIENKDYLIFENHLMDNLEKPTTIKYIYEPV